MNLRFKCLCSCVFLREYMCVCVCVFFLIFFSLNPDYSCLRHILFGSVGEIIHFNNSDVIRNDAIYDARKQFGGGGLEHRRSTFAKPAKNP